MITARGTALLTGSAVLAAAAWALASEALAVLAACGLLAVIAGASLVLALPRARTMPRLERRTVTRGEPVRLTIQLPAGRAALLPRPDILLVSPTHAPRLTMAEKRRGGEVEATVDTDRHGVITVGPLMVRHTDPLSLFRIDVAAGGARTVRVLPRVLPVPAGGTGRASLTEGRRRVTAASGGAELYMLHEYQPGDDVRRIHWASSARTGTLLVRRDGIVDEPTRYLWLDTRAAAYRSAADFEEAVDTAASLAADAARRGHTVRLWTSSGAAVSCSSGRAGAARAVDMLTLAQPAGPAPGWRKRPRRGERDGGTAAGLLRPPARGMLTVITGDAAPGPPLPGRPAGRGRLIILHLGSSGRMAAEDPDRATQRRHAADAARALLLWSTASRAFAGGCP